MRFRTDKNGIVHGGIGKIDFEPAALKATSLLSWQTLKGEACGSERRLLPQGHAVDHYGSRHHRSRRNRYLMK